MDEFSDFDNSEYLLESNLDKYYSEYSLIVKQFENNRKKFEKLEKKIQEKKNNQIEFSDEITEVTLKNGSVFENIMNNELKRVSKVSKKLFIILN